MTNILFLVVENFRQYYGSPPCQGSLLHLVYESAPSNISIHPTGITPDVIENSPRAAVPPGG
jgi:hypothetical protein